MNVITVARRRESNQIDLCFSWCNLFYISRVTTSISIFLDQSRYHISFQIIETYLKKESRESGKTTLNAFMTKALLNRNQFIDLLCKSIDWFLYDRKLRYERVKLYVLTIISIETSAEAYLELCQAVKMELFGENG